MFNVFSNSAIKWKSNPGCFERHLQRRYQNPLFLKDRRIVSSADLFEARAKDMDDFQDFVRKFSNYQLRTPDELGSPQEMSQILQDELDPLITLGIGVSGEAFNMVNSLIKMEELIFDYLAKYHSASPEIIKSFNQIKSLSEAERIPFIIQSVRKDSPVLKGEIVATFLSEDLNTIRHCGLLARSFPGWEWKDSDVVECLKRGVEEGFNEKKAAVLLEAYTGN